MTTLLIVESNTPAIVTVGQAGAFGFVRAFAGFAPEVRLRLTAPYAAALQREELRGVDGVIFSGSGVPWGVDTVEAKPRVGHGAAGGQRGAAQTLGADTAVR